MKRNRYSYSLEASCGEAEENRQVLIPSRKRFLAFCFLGREFALILSIWKIWNAVKLRTQSGICSVQVNTY